MAKNNSLLIIIDPTADEQPALARGEWLAEKLGASVELFICDYDQYLAGERFFDSKALKKARAGLLDRHRKRLEKLAAPLRQRGLTVSVDAAWDHPLHEGFQRHIDASDPRLVVKDTHYHSAIRRTLLSNTDWNLIRTCKAPLWLVKPHEAPAIGTLLAAVDPLHERDKPARLDHQILDTAEDIRAAIDGRLEVVHAFDPAPVYAVSTDAMSFPITEPIKEAVDSLRDEHRKALVGLLSQHGIDSQNARLIEGNTREVLIDAVDDFGADVVVIGAVSRSALKRMVLGSTAEHVLDHLPCDLLIVKPE